jgi:formyltetrahydrofolate-dependent phosphoribosylglycinamide formyltransferase
VQKLLEPLDRPVRLAVFLSGGGRTLVNLLGAIGRGELRAEVVVVVTDREEVGGIERAAEAGLKTTVLVRQDYASAGDWSDAAFGACRDMGADLVVLAGFLSLVEVPEDFGLRVLNIHPSLIPAFCGRGFYGERVHRAAIERGVRISGCTVHLVDNEYDHGPIILQKTVPVLGDDSPESLADRVFEAECEAYPEAIGLLADGRLSLVAGRLLTD